MKDSLRANIPHVAILGLPFAAITEDAATTWTLNRLAQRRGAWICPVNLDVLRQVDNDALTRKLVDSADLIVADGMPLIWASRLQGTPLPDRIAGSSLIYTLTAAAADAGHAIYLLGGNEGTAKATGVCLQRENPKLRLAGWHCPPFGFERSEKERQEIFRRLLEAKPDIVFVGLGFPKQDKLITELQPLLPSACFISCGISFSIVAGDVRRAPLLLQHAGLEWLYRLAQEPKRLFKRYLLLGLPFAARLSLVSAMARSKNSHSGFLVDIH